MSLPSVAVIVLNWNGEAYVGECLRSLRQLRYDGPFQVVVVDNGSEDGSVAMIKRDFPRMRLIESKVNRGFSAGNNLAARQLDTDLLAFINNDTRADPQWLDALVRVVTEAPDIAAVGGRILSWDGARTDFRGGGATLMGFGMQFGFGEPTTADDAEVDTLFPCGGSMIVKRQPYLEVGGLDDDYFLFYEDVDLGWRFWLAGYRVRYAPTSIAYHYHHRSTRRFRPERLAVLYERNALYTIFKNYEEQNLARILPAALLLTAERAAILAGLDRRRFTGAAAVASSASPNGAGKPGDLMKLRDSLRQQGVRQTTRRTWQALRRRLGPRLRRARVGLANRIAGQHEAVTVPADSVSRLLALEEFGTNLASLQEKRKMVQRLRRRADSEVLSLFKAPLDPGFDGPGFGEYHRRLMHALQLDRWVEETAGQQRPVPHP